MKSCKDENLFLNDSPWWNIFFFSFFPKRKCQRLKLTQGAVCQSVILSVSRCSPPSNPPLHQNTTPRWMGGYRQPLISSHWPCSRITANTEPSIWSALQERAMAHVRVRSAVTASSICMHVVLLLYVPINGSSVLFVCRCVPRLYQFLESLLCLCLTPHPDEGGYIWKHIFSSG